MTDIISRVRNSKFRYIFLPIRSGEFAKFFPMAALMFIILLNQNIIRIMKDSIVMTLVGPEVISFIKLWGEMPAGIIFVVIYAKMCNVMTTEKAFRIIVLFFLVFFAFFGFVLFPFSEYFHPDPAYIYDLVILMPHLKWFIIIWGKWSYVVFYIMGELWPIVVFSLLYWQLANKITKTEEATRFYSFFSLFGQFNLLVSGSVIMYFKSSSHCLLFLFDEIQDKTQLMLKSLIAVVLLLGSLLLAIHYYIEKKIMTDTRFYKPKANKSTLKLTLKESLKMIFSSRYLGLICIIIVCYGMTINLLEGVWFSKVRDQYVTPEGFMAYQGIVLFWTGVFATVCALIGSSIIRYMGWYTAAVITPLMTLVAGGIFFAFVSVEDNLAEIFSGITYLAPLAIITFIGGLQNVLGKGAKYSLFDATKEMAYIPLDEEMKAKGKAAVDVLGNKLGKSSGAIVQFIAFTMFPGASYDDIAGFLGLIFIVVCIIWVYAVKRLSVEYSNLLKETNENAS